MPSLHHLCQQAIFKQFLLVDSQNTKAEITHPMAKLLAQLAAQFGSDEHQLIDLKFINQYAKKHHFEMEFVDQAYFDNDKRYYEQIIFETLKIPTRANWHDFFNAMIWIHFPLTKRYLCQLHNQQIEEFGALPRTKVRDRITHFDECGLVLLTTCRDLDKHISEHNWQAVFVEKKDLWHKQIIPIMFGHALWESFLNPFIGFTAKVKVIVVESEITTETIFKQEQNLFPIVQDNKGQGLCIDKLLYDCLRNEACFEQVKPWRPLPLLGIPDWSPFEQNDEFYHNQAYFMPKRPAKSA